MSMKFVIKVSIGTIAISESSKKDYFEAIRLYEISKELSHNRRPSPGPCSIMKSEIWDKRKSMQKRLRSEQLKRTWCYGSSDVKNNQLCQKLLTDQQCAID